MYSHILIPTDGSETAARGVAQGFALALALAARVTVITVTERLPSYSGVTDMGFGPGAEVIAAWDRNQKQAAEALLAAVHAEATAKGIPAAVLHVPNTTPAEAIVQAARDHGADLIVMASHGRRGLGRLLLGSQAQAVLTHSPVPVLVVR
jgi:nucleotide-binding universal stress UspA family protein